MEGKIYIIKKYKKVYSKEYVTKDDEIVIYGDEFSLIVTLGKMV